MYCPHCGKENPQGALYCVNCGGKLPELTGDIKASPEKAPPVDIPEKQNIGRAPEATPKSGGEDSSRPLSDLKASGLSRDTNKSNIWLKILAAVLTTTLLVMGGYLWLTNKKPVSEINPPQPVPSNHCSLSISSSKEADWVLKNQRGETIGQGTGTAQKFAGLEAGEYSILVTGKKSGLYQVYEPVKIAGKATFNPAFATLIVSLAGTQGGQKNYRLRVFDPAMHAEAGEFTFDGKGVFVLDDIPVPWTRSREIVLQLLYGGQIKQDTLVYLNANKTSQHTFTLKEKTRKKKREDKEDTAQLQSPKEDSRKTGIRYQQEVADYHFRLQSNVPLKGARITFGNKEIFPDREGVFHVHQSRDTLRVVKQGYSPVVQEIVLRAGKVIEWRLSLHPGSKSGVYINLGPRSWQDLRFIWNGVALDSRQILPLPDQQAVLLVISGKGELAIQQSGFQVFRRQLEIRDGEPAPTLVYQECPEKVSVDFYTGGFTDCTSLYNTKIRLEYPPECRDACDAEFTILDNILDRKICGMQAVVHLSKEMNETTFVWDFAANQEFRFKWPPCKRELRIDFFGLHFAEEERHKLEIIFEDNTLPKEWLSDNSVSIPSLSKDRGSLIIKWNDKWSIRDQRYFDFSKSHVIQLHQWHRVVFHASPPSPIIIYNTQLNKWIDFDPAGETVEIVSKQKRYLVNVKRGGNEIFRGQVVEIKNGQVELPLCSDQENRIIRKAESIFAQTALSLSGNPEALSSEERSDIRNDINNGRELVSKVRQNCAQCADCAALEILLSLADWQCRDQDQRTKIAVFKFEGIIKKGHRDVPLAQPDLAFAAYSASLRLLWEFISIVGNQENDLRRLQDLAKSIFVEMNEYHKQLPIVNTVQAEDLADGRYYYMKLIMGLNENGILANDRACEILKTLYWQGVNNRYREEKNGYEKALGCGQ